jgi:hypothetical protein
VDFDASVERFGQHGISVRRSHHGLHLITMYVEDSDGFHLEFFANIDDPHQGRDKLTRWGITIRD